MMNCGLKLRKRNLKIPQEELEKLFGSSDDDESFEGF